jgi:hypothetical protein
LQQHELDRLEQISPEKAKQRRKQINMSPPLHYNLEIGEKALSVVTLGPESISPTHAHDDPVLAFFPKEDLPIPRKKEGIRIIDGTRKNERKTLNGTGIFQALRSLRLGFGFLSNDSFNLPTKEALVENAHWSQEKLPPFSIDLPNVPDLLSGVKNAIPSLPQVNKKDSSSENLSKQNLIKPPHLQVKAFLEGILQGVEQREEISNNNKAIITKRQEAYEARKSAWKPPIPWQF